MPASFPPVLDAPGDATTAVAMATFDVDLVCTHANPAFGTVTGTGDRSVHGMTWEALFPELSPSQQATVAAVATDGPPVGEVDVTSAATGRIPTSENERRRRGRLVLHRVEGVRGVPGGRVLSVLGKLGAGPAVLVAPT